MPASFDPEPQTDEGYEASRRHLRKLFSDWSERTGAGISPDATELCLHYKWGYIDRHLTRWRCEDLDELLLELVPAKVILEDSEVDDVVAETLAFLTFLAEEGLADPAGDDIDTLSSHLDQIEPVFHRRLDDPSRYGRGKVFAMAASQAGVDFDDPESLANFVERYNAELHRGQARSTGRATPPGTSPRPRPRGKRKKR